MQKLYDHDGTVATRIKKVCDSDGFTNSQIKKVFDNDGTAAHVVYASEKEIVLTVSVVNGYAVNQETTNRASITYTIPEDIVSVTLTKMELTQPFGSSYGDVQLNWYQKAHAQSWYYGGGFSTTDAVVPQTWTVQAGDVIALYVAGYTNANVCSFNQTTTLTVHLTLSIC